LAEHHTSIACSLDLMGMLPGSGSGSGSGGAQAGGALDSALQGALGEMRALVLRRVGLTEEDVAQRIQVSEVV
jgi:hypothetical protein